jgi:hypothetical protein
VPVSAHEGNRLINWLISAVNTQARGGTPLAYTLWIGGGGVGQAVIPAMEGAASIEAEAPREGEQTQTQETQQQHQSQSEDNHRPRRR